MAPYILKLVWLVHFLVSLVLVLFTLSVICSIFTFLFRSVMLVESAQIQCACFQVLAQSPLKSQNLNFRRRKFCIFLFQRRSRPTSEGSHRLRRFSAKQRSAPAYTPALPEAFRPVPLRHPAHPTVQALLRQSQHLRRHRTTFLQLAQTRYFHYGDGMNVLI